MMGIIYEFLVMPFGLTNAHSTFQGLMNDVFRQFLRKFVLLFFDDILVYSRTWDNHLEHLEIVFKLLQNHQLYAKKSKCSFAVKQVEYLGHIISMNRVGMDPQRIEAILSFTIPNSIKSYMNFQDWLGTITDLSKDMQ